MRAPLPGAARHWTRDNATDTQHLLRFFLLRGMLDHCLPAGSDSFPDRCMTKTSPPDKPVSPENATRDAELMTNSVLYKEFLAEREEILRHKWLESEKAGHDIGFEKALLDWIVKHRSSWREKRKDQQARHGGGAGGSGEARPETAAR